MFDKNLKKFQDTFFEDKFFFSLIVRKNKDSTSNYNEKQINYVLNTYT